MGGTQGAMIAIGSVSVSGLAFLLGMMGVHRKRLVKYPSHFLCVYLILLFIYTLIVLGQIVWTM